MKFKETFYQKSQGHIRVKSGQIRVFELALVTIYALFFVLKFVTFQIVDDTIFYSWVTYPRSTKT
jgi:hypothetical protein